MNPSVRKVGFTTTIPSEVVYAAGAIPVDLNNVFITSDTRDDFITTAEKHGYPRNVCGWIKGIYGVIAGTSNIDTVIAVTQGDCSNTHALMETLHLLGIRTIPFSYPYNRDYDTLSREISLLAETLGTTIGEAEHVRESLEPVRKKLDRLDELTWQENRVTGYENHLWLVSSSDFNGNVDNFTEKLELFIHEAERRSPFQERIRLGYIGVPPIIDDLYDVIEENGARVVYNEIQRQFSLPKRNGGLVDLYLAYTYPYSIFHRLDDIASEVRRRSIHGIIHYVQSFCHRQIQDIVIRKKLDVPVLTIEGELPGNVDERTKIRIQAFIEMIDIKRH
jgi:benzoyl-CoA reductase/2-hydroxyglutaryl-CoA dehydratase subunit BcrC/BadD/HgdB